MLSEGEKSAGGNCELGLTTCRHRALGGSWLELQAGGHSPGGGQSCPESHGDQQQRRNHRGQSVERGAWASGALSPGGRGHVASPSPRKGSFMHKAGTDHHLQVRSDAFKGSGTGAPGE